LNKSTSHDRLSVTQLKGANESENVKLHLLAISTYVYVGGWQT